MLQFWVLQLWHLQSHQPDALFHAWCHNLRAAPMQIMTNLMKIASYLAHGILSTGEPFKTWPVHRWPLESCSRPAQLPA